MRVVYVTLVIALIAGLMGLELLASRVPDQSSMPTHVGRSAPERALGRL
jgi:hypothetical protein